MDSGTQGPNSLILNQDGLISEVRGLPPGPLLMREAAVESSFLARVFRKASRETLLSGPGNESFFFFGLFHSLPALAFSPTIVDPPVEYVSVHVHAHTHMCVRMCFSLPFPTPLPLSLSLSLCLLLTRSPSLTHIFSSLTHSCPGSIWKANRERRPSRLRTSQEQKKDNGSSSLWALQPFLPQPQDF